MSTTSAPETFLVTLTELRAAAETLRGVAVRTPLFPARPLSTDELGVGLWLKPESLQRGGVFKFRGAYTYLARLDPTVRARGVIAPSSGNHAQAVALAAQLFGVSATAVMPTTVTAAKRTGVERLGARLVLAGTTTHHRIGRALELSRAEGGVIVPPADDRTIIAGQGTVGLEIVEDLPDVGTVLVPLGGGELSAAVAAAMRRWHVPWSARSWPTTTRGSPSAGRANRSCWTTGRSRCGSASRTEAVPRPALRWMSRGPSPASRTSSWCRPSRSPRPSASRGRSCCRLSHSDCISPRSCTA